MARILVEMECTDLHEYHLVIEHPKARAGDTPDEWPFDPGKGKCPKCGALDDLDTCSTDSRAALATSTARSPRGEWLPEQKTRGRL